MTVPFFSDFHQAVYRANRIGPEKSPVSLRLSLPFIDALINQEVFRFLTYIPGHVILAIGQSERPTNIDI